MKLLKSTSKRTGKQEKEKRILMALVEYYLKSGKPVGSNTLKDVGFPDLSSATIRNYFANLEAEGYLMQQHTSGGRTPTEKAYRLYAEECLAELGSTSLSNVPHLTTSDAAEDMREVALFMQRIAEASAEHAGCPVFFTSPRFDQDFVSEIKLVSIDQSRALAIILTTFGQVFTELLHSPHKLNLHALHRIEGYFQSRLRAVEPEVLESQEHELAVRFYQEIMARYLVSYANFTQEELFCTGFSKLLRYPEFQEAEKLTSALSLFENKLALRSLSRDAMRANQMKCWIGEDLKAFLSTAPNCSLITAPYQIASKPVGAIGIIGSMRMPYKSLFMLLRSVAAEISRYLEKNLYRYKISFREATAKVNSLDFQARKLLSGPKSTLALEDHHILGIDD